MFESHARLAITSLSASESQGKLRKTGQIEFSNGVDIPDYPTCKNVENELFLDALKHLSLLPENFSSFSFPFFEKLPKLLPWNEAAHRVRFSKNVTH